MLNGHYNKNELVELLTQRGVLPATYTGGDGSRIGKLPIHLVRTLRITPLVQPNIHLRPIFECVLDELN
jgi:hypothetical protein